MSRKSHPQIREVLALNGPETKETRELLRGAVVRVFSMSGLRPSMGTAALVIGSGLFRDSLGM